MKKRILIAAILVCMTVVLAACGGNGLEGKWKLDPGSFASFGALPDDAGVFFTFKGGTLTVEMEYQGTKTSMEAKYTVDGENLKIEGGDVMNGDATFKVDGNKLTITSNGVAVVFNRQ